MKKSKEEKSPKSHVENQKIANGYFRETNEKVKGREDVDWSIFSTIRVWCWCKVKLN